MLVWIGAGCGNRLKVQEGPRAAQVKWYAHCDTCNWCKGSFKTTEDVQEVVSNHNKQVHDWIKVAYYSQVKCP